MRSFRICGFIPLLVLAAAVSAAGATPPPDNATPLYNAPSMDFALASASSVQPPNGEAVRSGVTSPLAAMVVAGAAQTISYHSGFTAQAMCMDVHQCALGGSMPIATARAPSFAGLWPIPSPAPAGSSMQARSITIALMVSLIVFALAAERDTQERGSSLLALPVGAGKKIFAGGLTVLGGGYAEPGTAATDKIAIGRAEETVDNTAGDDGDATVLVKRGIFRFKNSGDITQAQCGDLCYIVDDETVSASDGGGARSVAGRIEGIESGGVWVAVGITANPASAAGLSALVAAGLGNSASYIKTKNDTTTLVAADAANDRAVLVVVTVDEAFADAGGTQPTFKIGEAATLNKFADTGAFTDAVAGSTFIFAGTNTSTKAIQVTGAAATGAGTGGISVTVIALPTA